MQFNHKVDRWLLDCVTSQAWRCTKHDVTNHVRHTQEDIEMNWLFIIIVSNMSINGMGRRLIVRLFPYFIIYNNAFKPNVQSNPGACYCKYSNLNVANMRKLFGKTHSLTLYVIQPAHTIIKLQRVFLITNTLLQPMKLLWSFEFIKDFFLQLL